MVKSLPLESRPVDGLTEDNSTGVDKDIQSENADLGYFLPTILETLIYRRSRGARHYHLDHIRQQAGYCP